MAPVGRYRRNPELPGKGRCPELPLPAPNVFNGNNAAKTPAALNAPGAFTTSRLNQDSSSFSWSSFSVARLWIGKNAGGVEMHAVTAQNLSQTKKGAGKNPAPHGRSGISDEGERPATMPGTGQEPEMLPKRVSIASGSTTHNLHEP
ncbi:hypothetical protein SCL_1110 [Sulfuricaulis limicola]|uniref:Uncharacterized protein n=1 Tax=Sulfuricaulis limicola TaxID=1620215 RepID=A0A1B4XF38_9GAMM|nr:hypothetical protein SCL_1110 [Sulfuricaulis limicola]